jgi:hypothetical protein
MHWAVFIFFWNFFFLGVGLRACGICFNSPWFIVALLTLVAWTSQTIAERSVPEGEVNYPDDGDIELTRKNRVGRLLGAFQVRVFSFSFLFFFWVLGKWKMRKWQKGTRWVKPREHNNMGWRDGREKKKERKEKEEMNLLGMRDRLQIVA